MATNAVVRSRISVDVKEKATAVLEEMGLTVSDVMRIVLTRVANENALPFDLKPNKITRETMRKTAQGLESIRLRMLLTSITSWESDALPELFQPISP